MVVIIHVCPTSNVFLELFSNVILSSWLAVPQIQEDFTLRITGWNSSEDNNSNERIWINGKRVGLVAADSSGVEKVSEISGILVARFWTKQGVT